jgi:hypothetical protein
MTSVSFREGFFEVSDEAHSLLISIYLKCRCADITTLTIDCRVGKSQEPISCMKVKVLADSMCEDGGGGGWHKNRPSCVRTLKNHKNHLDGGDRDTTSVFSWPTRYSIANHMG